MDHNFFTEYDQHEEARKSAIKPLNENISKKKDETNGKYKSNQAGSKAIANQCRQQTLAPENPFFIRSVILF